MTATHAPARALIKPGASIPLREAITGWPIMVALILRRNWLRMIIWVVVLVIMVPLTSESQRAIFPTQADRDAYAALANTPSVAALTGLPYAAGTLGGILVIKIWMTVAVALAFATTFLVVRNGRADEEEGRTGLLRAGVLGSLGKPWASHLMIASFGLVVGALTALVTVGTGLPVEGSLIMGASFSGLAWTFQGVAAVADQLASTSRGANMICAAVVGVAYLIRAVGDLSGSATTPHWVSWTSPIGWAQGMRPYGEDRWWPLALLVGTGVVLVAVSAALQLRRDVGAGLLADRPGPASADRFTGTGFGLAVRLQRGSLIGWSLAAIAMGGLYGSISSAMADMFTSDSPIGKAFAAQADSMIEAVLGLLVLLTALLASGFAVQSALQLRVEEASGRAELQLTGAVSRVHWAIGRLLVSVLGALAMLVIGGLLVGLTETSAATDPAGAWRLTWAALVYLPGVLVMAGVVVMAIGFLPRHAAALSWGFFGVVAGFSMFGTVLGVPEAILDLTPLTATPTLPAEPLTLPPVLVLTVIAVLLWVIGLTQFARRDLDQSG